MSLLNYFKKVPNASSAARNVAVAADKENGKTLISPGDLCRKRHNSSNAADLASRPDLKKVKGEALVEPESKELASTSKDYPPYLELEKRNMGADWFEAFLPTMKKLYFKTIKDHLEQEKAKRVVVYPPESEIYTFAKYPLADVRVVIIGQDPYHNVNQAHGLCFSVKPGVPPPPSLQNIYKELADDLGPERFKAPKHGYLEGWSKQGVLLLNASLTVRANSPASHSSIGWQQFTDEIIRYIDKNCPHVVFLLWGRHAQVKAAGVNQTKHLVLKAVHPSPLSAHRGFFGCHHFSKCNAFLEKKGLVPINWSDLPAGGL